LVPRWSAAVGFLGIALLALLADAVLNNVSAYLNDEENIGVR